MRDSSPVGWWWGTMTTLAAASITIWLRTWTVPAAMARGDPWGKAETRRMVTEKAFALQDGYLAAWRTALLLPWIRIWQTDAALNHLVRTGQAFSRPGVRKARANAKRLSRLR